MAFESLQQIVDLCDKEQKSVYEIVLENDCDERKVTREDSLLQMEATWDAILLASSTYEEKLVSASGLVGTDGAKMERYMKNENSLCGSYMNLVMAHALQMGESNACMKRIVAAPTAGSCGVLPAVLVPYFMHKKADTPKIIEAMYVSAGIGQVIASRASISGAEGGCQAEIGSASAMAASAMTYLQGGDPEQIIHAAAISLKSLLGLVCDPVAGLVEVPCVKRNVIGAVNAMSATDMVMAGIKSRIPPDQVIDAMKEVGDKMDVSLRETGKGGLAATSEAVKICQMLQNKL
ncbi:MAG: L-serine ammonia-lyase, iron-sulfur-dependent, subunit alpha [Lachnospiraceae bacterium]|nr:L-serine ammonia-lyase, iron-sulfur-dependent, subunit alpha [Lachnospiraceae bacterium]